MVSSERAAVGSARLRRNITANGFADERLRARSIATALSVARIAGQMKTTQPLTAQ